MKVIEAASFTVAFALCMGLAEAAVAGIPVSAEAEATITAAPILDERALYANPSQMGFGYFDYGCKFCIVKYSFTIGC